MTHQQAEKGVTKLKDYYCIPKWCRMPPMGHFDGMGGCWSISSGLVLAKGEIVCRKCEYYEKQMRNPPGRHALRGLRLRTRYPYSSASA
mgnify:CR=1 FL=1